MGNFVGGTAMTFFCCLQMEVTFNFLEIRAMNTYPEHQVTPNVSFHCISFIFLLFKLFCLC